MWKAFLAYLLIKRMSSAVFRRILLPMNTSEIKIFSKITNILPQWYRISCIQNLSLHHWVAPKHPDLALMTSGIAVICGRQCFLSYTGKIHLVEMYFFLLLLWGWGGRDHVVNQFVLLHLRVLIGSHMFLSLATSQTWCNMPRKFMPVKAK